LLQVGSGQLIHLLTFTVGGRTLALLASAVTEVVRAVAVTELPKAPPIVEGVINFRGRIVPVLDVRQRFGLTPRSLDPDQHFIIAQAGPRRVALRVDRAFDVIGVEARAIESSALVAPGAEYVAGIARLPDGLLVIHDLESFLALDEAAALDTALGAPGRDSKEVG
jgi:purine-binding chemotaxis protein CheW